MATGSPYMLTLWRLVIWLYFVLESMLIIYYINKYGGEGGGWDGGWREAEELWEGGAVGVGFVGGEHI